MFKKSLLLFLLISFTASPVYAASPTVESLELSVNLVWLMFGAVLVFLCMPVLQWLNLVLHALKIR